MDIEKEIAAMREQLRLLTELVNNTLATNQKVLDKARRYVFVEKTYVYGDCKLSRYLHFPDVKTNIDKPNIIGSMAFHNGEATFFTSKEEARQTYSKYNCELLYPKFVLEEVYEDMCGLFATKSITD